MSYIENSLGKDEEIKHLFEFHWFININIAIRYIIFGLMAYGFFSALGFFSLTFLSIPVIYHLGYITTEMGATNKRVILKKGIIARKTEEQILANVETIAVNQGILGRIFGFGDVIITGTGASWMIFNQLDDPIKVKKAIEILL